ncbi:MAG: response regulator [Deltaproteobacteria bacterium]|nr:response regulator [Deltaproteobacteria bacterium]
MGAECRPTELLGEDMTYQVLVVEDEPDLQIIYRDVLSKEGFDVHLTGDGEEAFHRFQNEHFDLMVVDFLLPKMDGVEFLEQVDKLGGRPAIFASAVMRDEVTIQHLKNMGVRWFLEKPFRLSALRLILEEARELLDKRAA